MRGLILKWKHAVSCFVWLGVFVLSACLSTPEADEGVTADDLIGAQGDEANNLADHNEDVQSDDAFRFEEVSFWTDELDIREASDEEPRLGAPYPIVLVHGFSGFLDLGPLEYFFQIAEHLDEQGVEVFTPVTTPYNSVDVRADLLALEVDSILERTGREKVHLICHSQGGLECRRLVSRLGYHDKVSGLITIATPHFGTPMAEAVGITPEGMLNPAGQFLAFMLGLLEELPSGFEEGEDIEVGDWETDLLAASEDMTPAGADKFNESHPDHPMVTVYSVAASSDLIDAGELCDDGLLFERPDRVDALDPLLWVPSRLLVGPDLFNPIPHDGLLQTHSMKWGTFLGCVPADHLDQIGQISDLLPNVLSGFSHHAMFDELVAFLRTLEPSAEE